MVCLLVLALKNQSLPHRPFFHMLLPYVSSLNKKNIILASASPRRKYALEQLGLRFSIVPSTFAENLDKSTFENPSGYVTETARRKAHDVYGKIIESGQTVDLLISADSIVVLDGQILEKPSDEEHAKAMIGSLSGRAHNVITAIVLLYPGPNGKCQEFAFHESTKVQFSVLSSEMVSAYVATGTPMDKAGGYGIQEVIGGSFVESIEGDYYNVTGFPVNRFCLTIVSLCKEGKL